MLYWARMIKKILNFLFAPIEVKTVRDCQKEFDELCEQAYREAVADVSRGNVNLVAGCYRTKKDFQARCQRAINKLKGI